MNNQPKTFDNFDFSRVELWNTGANWNQFIESSQDYKFKMKRIQNEILTEFVSSGYNRLILWGLQGRGKTHLAKAILNQHRYRNSIYTEGSPYYGKQSWEFDREGIVLTDIEPCREMYDLFFNMQPYIEYDVKEKANREYRYIMKAQVLMIDDLGGEKETQKEVFPLGFLKFLDDYMIGKLIITTNLAPISILKRYKAKIFSRLFENALVICINGKDYRLRSENEI